MSQIEAKTKKNSEFTCSNASCGKDFSKPLRALNLRQDPEEPYDACPYCLTKIKLKDEPTTVFDEPETFEPEETKTETEVEEQKLIDEQVETPEAPSACPHHLGYLSERSSKEQIPDECMMCKDIVSCMLKKMRG
jgi:DNA-directed RNA polymerase subunit RPC12/RpoP